MPVAASSASPAARLFVERDQVEIGGTLGHRLERLAVEAERRAHPEAIDRIGQQQHLDVARLVAFELRARRRLRRILGGEIIDRRLVRLEAGDIVLERDGLALGRAEARDLEELVAPLHVLIEAFLDDRAEGVPDLGEALGHRSRRIS